MFDRNLQFDWFPWWAHLHFAASSAAKTKATSCLSCCELVSAEPESDEHSRCTPSSGGWGSSKSSSTVRGFGPSCSRSNPGFLKLSFVFLFFKSLCKSLNTINRFCADFNFLWLSKLTSTRREKEKKFFKFSSVQPINYFAYFSSLNAVG